MAPEPLDATTVRSYLHLGKILALVIAILSVVWAAFVIVATFGFGVFNAAFLIIAFIVCLLIYLQIGQIEALANARQYGAAKERLLIWMILGFIFGYLIVGIILLLAYLKFDDLINWQRAASGQPGWGQPAAAWQQAPPGGAWAPPAQQAAPAWPAPQPAPAWPSPQPTVVVTTPAAAAPAAAPMPAPAPVAPAAPVCPRCGRPATWIAQYSRWYCYTDQQYL
jgi:hypothetical protein